MHLAKVGAKHKFLKLLQVFIFHFPGPVEVKFSDRCAFIRVDKEFDGESRKSLIQPLSLGN